MMVKVEKGCPFCQSRAIYAVPIQIGYETNYDCDKTVGLFCNTCKMTVILEDNEEEGFTQENINKAITAWDTRK